MLIKLQTKLLFMLKTYVPKNIVKTIYNIFILPHLTYGILAWGFSKTHLFKLQKQTIRLISHSKFNSHTEPLFKSLALLKLEDLFKLNTLKFYFKYKNNDLPKYFLTYNCITRSDIHIHNTR